MISDQILLERYAKAADAEAFTEIVDRYGSFVYGVALRITRSIQDAEDVTQACFMDLAAQASSIRSSVPGWLHHLARWKAMGLIRSGVRRRERETLAAEEVEPWVPDKQWETLSSAIDDAMEKLDEMSRTLIILYYFNRKSHDDIADMLNMSRPTVQRRCQAAVDKLRDLLCGMDVDVSVGSLLVGISALMSTKAPAMLNVGLAKIGLSGLGGGANAGIGVVQPSLWGGLAMKAGIGVALMLAVAGTAVVVTKTVGQNGMSRANSGSGKTLLGSPDFYPSPERPIGWRGDWTGKFSGATPVLSWGLWPKGPFKDLQSLADKPKSDSKGTPMQHGILKEWLIAGPVDVDDPKESIDKSFIGDETKIEPAEGMKSGSLEWKKYDGWFKHGRGTTPMCITASKAPGKEDDPLAKPAVYYTHSYVYSPMNATVRFYDSDNSDRQTIRLWVNGKIVLNKTPEQTTPGNAETVISLVQGWNRFLVKHCVSAKGKIRPFALRLIPDSIDLSIRNRKAPEVESENLVWSIPTQGGSVGTPLVIGDKVFFGIDRRFFVCADRNTGKVLWAKALTFLDTIPEDTWKGDKEFMARVKGLKPKLSAAIGEVQEATKFVVRDLNALLTRLEESNSFAGPPSVDMTPCSDGKYIFHATQQGLTTCMDLDGNVIWAQAIPTHGTHHQITSSPLLAGDKCIVLWRKFLAYDKKTGKLLWTMPREDEKPQETECSYCSPIAFKVGDDFGLLSWNLVRASDGKRLWGFNDDKLPYGSFGPQATPIVADGTIYTLGGPNETIYVLKCPATLSDNLKMDVKTLPYEKMNVASRWGDTYFIASLLYHDGLIYSAGMLGTLRVQDVKAGKQIYMKVLPSVPQERYGNAGGIDASIAMAGNHIFITDNAGTICVVEPGPQYKLTAVNSIVSLDARGDQDTKFESTPVFVGDKMYIRGGSAMYCFGKK